MSLKELFTTLCPMPQATSNTRSKSVSGHNAGVSRRRCGKLRQLWLSMPGYASQEQLAIAWTCREPDRIPLSPEEAAAIEELLELLGEDND